MTTILCALALLSYMTTAAPMIFAQNAPEQKTESPTIESETEASDEALLAKIIDFDYLKENFTPIGFANFAENPDLPMLIFISNRGNFLLTLVLDARNGTEAWSLTKDPIVIINIKYGEKERTFVDTGFMTGGKASKKFEEIIEQKNPPENKPAKYDI